MQDTCKKECHFWKKYGDKCPNYIRSGWRSSESQEEITVHDCAPIRTLLMIQELYNKFIGVQQASEETRNVLIDLGRLAEVKRLKYGVED